MNGSKVLLVRVVAVVVVPILTILITVAKTPPAPAAAPPVAILLLMVVLLVVQLQVVVVVVVKINYSCSFTVTRPSIDRCMPPQTQPIVDFSPMDTKETVVDHCHRHQHQ